MLDFDASAAFAGYVLTRAGLRCVEGERQAWSVGNHELTVELKLDKARYIYVLWVRDGWPTRPIRRSPLCLAEVYAATLTGELRDLGNPEQGWFKTKAILDAGLHPRPDVRLAPLPDDATSAEWETWEVIRDVVEVRAAQGRPPDEPVPLSAPWLASLNGTAENTIRAGKRGLQRRRFITVIDERPSKRGRPLQLWRVTRP